MYTECPACNTIFRVHAEQLAAARGKVRCGDCMAVFDAREYRRDDLEEETPQPSPTPEVVPEEQGSLALEVAQETTAPAPSAPNPVAVEITASAATEPEESAPVAPANIALPAEPARAAAHSSNSEPLPFFADDFAPTATTKRPLSRAWWVFSVALLFLLLGQYLWFNRVALSQVPSLRPTITALCATLPCGLEAVPDSGAFELTHRSVQSHPSYQGALLIDATFVNRSSSPRPYPGLELLFTDMEGKPLASRRFLPQEYLGRLPQQPLAPGAEAHVALELLDPGDLAVGYEFRFF